MFINITVALSWSRHVFVWNNIWHALFTHSIPTQRGRGRLINRPMQPIKTGGNNPDKKQIWGLSYKTNLSCTPFFKSSSGWSTKEMSPCGCRICFSLIALSGYLIRWQMTKTPPVTERLSLCLSLTHKLFHTIHSLSFLLTHSHEHLFSRTCSTATKLSVKFHLVHLLAFLCLRNKSSLKWKWVALSLKSEKIYR